MENVGIAENTGKSVLNSGTTGKTIIINFTVTELIRVSTNILLPEVENHSAVSIQQY